MLSDDDDMTTCACFINVRIAARTELKETEDTQHVLLLIHCWPAHSELPREFSRGHLTLVTRLSISLLPAGFTVKAMTGNAPALIPDNENGVRGESIDITRSNRAYGSVLSLALR